MTNLDEIAKRMKSDWDRRISHDYRFWMSDGKSSDQVMWQSGERDLSILLQGLNPNTNQTFLEVGCGVGRLLRAASFRFGKVIGVDVSEQAINQGQTLLADRSNVELRLGNGVDLREIPDNSIDCVVSFAALTSMPTDVIASYLKEMQRIVKPDGTVRLQVYVGQEQPVHSEDTLHIRCYGKDKLQQAFELAGLTQEWIKELELPFQVSFKELDIVAMIVSLHKSTANAKDIAEISKALLPNGEKRETEIVEGSALEYWMTVNYAKELVEQGDNEKAKATLEYASRVTKNMTIDVQDSLSDLINKIDKNSGTKEKTISVSQFGSANLYEKNLKVLEAKHPSTFAKLKNYLNSSAPTEELRVEQTEQGPVIFYRGICLDHNTKPVSASANWSKQILKGEKYTQAENLVVYGMASAYHIEELLRIQSANLQVIEPSWAVFNMALQIRDLSEMLNKVTALTVGTENQPENMDNSSEILVRPQSQGLEPEYFKRIRAGFYGARGLSKLKPKIAVLGPLAGGTLPIMGYSTLALKCLQQKVREIDVSGFGRGYTEMEKLISNELLRASSISNYVETISKVIVNSATEKPFDILVCMAQAPISGSALTELRKRGVITVLWFVEDYLRFTAWKDMAQYYDFIFTIQRGDCIEQIKQAGCPEVHYLPTACDPYVHSPISLTPEEKERWGSPVSFVGAGYHNRQQMFASLANFPFKIWGTEWPTCKPFDRLVQEAGRRLTPAEYIKIFNGTDVNLNLHSSTERDGIDPSGDFLNPRTFELASCGAFQLIDPRILLGEVFEPGKDVVTFDSTADLKEKINYYIAHPEERKIYTERARKIVLDKHTYQHRFKDMLSIIYSSRYEQLLQRENANPWKKILAHAKPHPELHERCQVAYERGEEASLDALVSDIVTGKGDLSDTEMKLLFLFHVSQQIIRHKREEQGG